MPSYRSHCAVCNQEFEWRSATMTAEDPACPVCHGETERRYFPIGAIWCKPLAAYGDPKSEGFQKQQKAGGHWTLEQDKESGKVSKVFIDTPKAQSDYCKKNGLIDPKNLPSNLTVDANGTGYVKENISEI